MKGYYVPDESGKGSSVPMGRLRIEASNLPEFKELLESAKREANQLQRTINRLRTFELNIDFSVTEDITSES